MLAGRKQLETKTQEQKLPPKSFSRVKWRRIGPSWSPGKEARKEGQRIDGVRKRKKDFSPGKSPSKSPGKEGPGKEGQKGKQAEFTPVRIKVKRFPRYPTRGWSESSMDHLLYKCEIRRQICPPSPIIRPHLSCH